MPPPVEHLLRRDLPPTGDLTHHHARLGGLGDNPRLGVLRPFPPPARPRQNLDPPRPAPRFVRHVVHTAHSQASRLEKTQHRKAAVRKKGGGAALTLEVLGEAAGRVSRESCAALPHLPWREMAGLRHRLIHGYAEVRLDLVWNVATERLGPLLAMLEPLLPPEEGRRKGHERGAAAGAVWAHARTATRVPPQGPSRPRRQADRCEGHWSGSRLQSANSSRSSRDPPAPLHSSKASAPRVASQTAKASRASAGPSRSSRAGRAAGGGNGSPT